MKSRTIDKYMKLDYELIVRRVRKYDEPFFEITTRELDASMFYGVGDSIDEAVSDFESAKHEGFLHLIQMGVDIPMPLPSRREMPSGRLVVRFPPSLHARLAKVAQEDDVSLNSLILSVCLQYVTVRDVIGMVTKDIVGAWACKQEKPGKPWTEANVTNIWQCTSLNSQEVFDEAEAVG